jgi:hypothetical protein
MKMDNARKLGIGVVLVVPAFVGSGIIWELFSNWWVVLVWVVIVAFLYGGFFSGKLSVSKIINEIKS